MQPQPIGRIRRAKYPENVRRWGGLVGTARGLGSIRDRPVLVMKEVVVVVGGSKGILAAPPLLLCPAITNSCGRIGPAPLSTLV